MVIKGITWVENICHKFEAMCQEVEEAMYQDTVKYMENKAHKVGVCVKKFYSEVMEDLLPPSHVHPVKESLNGLSLNPYEHSNNPLLSICDGHSSLKKKSNEDRVMSDVTAEKESYRGTYSVNSLSALSPRTSKHAKSPETWCEKSNKLGAYRRRIGIKRISQDNHLSNDSSHELTSFSGSRNAIPASFDMRSSSITALSKINVSPSSNLGEICGEAVKGHESMANNSAEPSGSKMNSSGEISSQNTDDSKCTSPVNNFPSKPVMSKKEVSECASSDRHLPTQDTDTFVNETSVSELGSSFRISTCRVESKIQAVETDEVKSMQGGFPNNSSGACNIEFKDKDDTMSEEGNLSKHAYTIEFKDENDTISNEGNSNQPTCDIEFKDKEDTMSDEANLNSNACNTEFRDQDDTMSNEDKFDAELIKNEEATGSTADIFELTEDTNLDNSCVLVQGNKLCSDPQGPSRMSYKNKIQKALSSKLRSTRKQDHFVSIQNDSDATKSAEMSVPELSSPSQLDDWELV